LLFVFKESSSLHSFFFGIFGLKLSKIFRFLCERTAVAIHAGAMFASAGRWCQYYFLTERKNEMAAGCYIEKTPNAQCRPQSVVAALAAASSEPEQAFAAANVSTSFGILQSNTAD
jgi:hypothetical protein